MRVRRAYNTDRNNFAPNLGFAWTIGGQGGILGNILGKTEGDSVLRGGYTLGYNRPGMSDFTGTIDDNPGIAQTASRNHTLGNLGTPGAIFFRNPADLGPPPFSVTRQYPMTDVVTGDILVFDPNFQVPYSQSWTAGWQRKLTNDIAIEARYVGTRSLPELDQLRLQRGQYRRERLPRRVPRRAAEPPDQRRQRRELLRVPRAGRAVAAADLPRVFLRADRRVK